METAGIAVIIIGTLYSSSIMVYNFIKTTNKNKIYVEYRRALGSGILLGLEFLVAGDIIRTVAVEPSFESVGVLAIIVAIRTFLSFTLELEMTGKWPWQKT